MPVYLLPLLCYYIGTMTNHRFFQMNIVKKASDYGCTISAGTIYEPQV
jgi:hypothetical protein